MRSLSERLSELSDVEGGGVGEGSCRPAAKGGGGRAPPPPLSGEVGPLMGDVPAVVLGGGMRIGGGRADGGPMVAARALTAAMLGAAVVV